MHMLLGATVSLAMFALLYIAVSVVVWGTWKLAAAACARRRPSLTAGILFAVRVLPFFAAMATTLTVTLPSFLLLEPSATDEPIGAAPFVLGCGCLALLIFGVARALQSQRRTSRAIAVLLRDAVPLQFPDHLTVYEAQEEGPALMVAGMRPATVIVSRATISTLSKEELCTALRHEMAHVRRHDNFKKFMFRLCPFFGMSSLEAAWSHAAELAADDDAVRCERDALDLAAALIKVSRLTAPPAAELATALLLPASACLSARVQRLLEWENAERQNSRTPRYVVATLCASALMLMASYSTLLAQMHAFTEWLVR